MEALDPPKSSRGLPRSSRAPRPSTRPTIDISVRYPASWYAPMNPRSVAVEHRAAAWLKELGVIRDEEAMERFEALSVAAYGGYPFPLADEERLEVVTRFSTLWIFYDDHIEGAGESQERLLSGAIRGEPGAAFGGDPCIRGWWEIARRYRPAMSEAWLTRHAARYMEWLRAVREEAEVARRAQETGVWPSIEQYMALRRVTIGMLPTVDFIEYATGEELPEAVREQAAFREIERLSAEVVALPNDLFGFSKDRRAGWLNAVFSMAGETGVPLEDAMGIVAAMHDRRVEEMMQLSRVLLAEAEAEARPRMERWLEGLFHIVHGFARWHEIAPRYNRVHALEGGRQARIAVLYA